VAYRLAADRVQVQSEDGPACEVAPILAYAVYVRGLSLAVAFDGAKDVAAELDALRALSVYFVQEAQPTWEILDHRGVIPATGDGMLRLPLETALAFVNGWLETATPKPTAVDKMIPEGPLRDELNKGLRKARKTKVD
jgi:hypothetical protein